MGALTKLDEIIFKPQVLTQSGTIPEHGHGKPETKCGSFPE